MPAAGQYSMTFQLSRPHHKAWYRDEGVLQCGAALLYAVTATSMSLINRFALLAFPMPTILLLLQMSATLLVLWPLLAARVLCFPLFRFTRFCQLFGISALYTANTAFALFGLKTLNLPMYTAIKRLTPMLILIIKSVWKRSWPQPRLTFSVALVVLGCLIAGAGDLAFDGAAYAFAFASCIMQALYLLLVEFQGDAGASSTSELLWYNALTSLPLLCVITVATGDVGRAAPALAAGVAKHGTGYVYAIIAAAATLGMLLNYSMFLCTMLTTALTTTIVGVLRGVATILLGFALDTVPFSPVNVAGIALNTLGGVLYSLIKYQEKYGKSGGGGLLKSGAGAAYAPLPTADAGGGGPRGEKDSADGAHSHGRSSDDEEAGAAGGDALRAAQVRASRGLHTGGAAAAR